MAEVRSARLPIMMSQATKCLLPQSRLCEISQAIPWSPNYHSETNPHAWRNSDHEVGNFGIYLGNWGERGSVNEAGKRRRRQVHDLQLLTCLPFTATTTTTSSVSSSIPNIIPTNTSSSRDTQEQTTETHSHIIRTICQIPACQIPAVFSTSVPHTSSCFH